MAPWKSSRAGSGQASEKESDSRRGYGVSKSMQRYLEILGSKIKPPAAIVMGAPGEVFALLELPQFGEATCYQMDCYPADRLRELITASGLSAKVITAADAWDVPGSFSSVIYIAPVAGERILKIDMLEQSYHLLRPGGAFFVLSPYYPDSFFPAQLKKTFGAVHASPAEDATVFWCTRKTDRSRRRHEVIFHAKDGDRPSREFISRPGIFSYGKLDDGTRALLECMVIEPGDQILDLGCGCGAAGIFAGIRGGAKSRVTFVDSNTRAIAVTQMNASRNELAGFATLAAWQPEKLTRQSADVVLANPPYFGRGEIAERFVEHALVALKSRGRLYLVTKLTEQFGELLTDAFEEVAAEEARGYVVFSARGKKR
jgi:16S rRNA G1207 methylase RsmC